MIKPPSFRENMLRHTIGDLREKAVVEREEVLREIARIAQSVIHEGANEYKEDLEQMEEVRRLRRLFLEELIIKKFMA